MAAACTSGRRANGLAFLPALGLAVIPKCPLCLVAYGALGTASALSPLYQVGLLPLNAAVLALAVGALVLRGRQRRNYGPAALALASAATVLVGKFWFDALWLLLAGLALLFVAVLWSARLPEHCPGCKPRSFPPPCLGANVPTEPPSG